MEQDQNFNLYRPPLSDVTDREQSSLGSIGLLTGLAFSLALTFTPAIILAIQHPYKLDKIVTILLASLIPQSVIVANAWWWSVRGKSTCVLQFLLVSAIQSSLLALSFISTTMLFFWVVIKRDISISDISNIDITIATVIFTVSFFLTSLVNLMVALRIRRALRHK